MPDWLKLVLGLWPIAVTITPLVLAGGIYWLQSKFPSKADFKAVADKVDKLDEDQIELSAAVRQLKADRTDPPTRIELMDKMSSLAARMSGVEATITAHGHQLGTANDYLQILVERGVR